MPNELPMAKIFAFNGSGKNPVVFSDLDACRERIHAAIQGRDNLALLLKDVMFYFERWFVFTTVVENDRTRHQFQGVPVFSWWSPTSEIVYRSSCLRFETIMSAVLYASILFNLGVQEELGKTPSVHYFLQAYVLLRHVCHVEIRAWKERDEYNLPLESTERGCVLLEMICLFKIQHNALREAFDRTQKQGSGAGSSNAFYESYARMSLWMLTECAEVEQRLLARKKDGSLQAFPWLEIIGSYHMEALGLYFLWNAKYATITYGNEQKRAENLCMLSFAQQSVDQFLRGESRFRRWRKKKKREAYAHEIASIRTRLEVLKHSIEGEMKAQKDSIALGLAASTQDTDALDVDPWTIVHVRRPLFVKAETPKGLEKYVFQRPPTEMYRALFPVSIRNATHDP